MDDRSKNRNQNVYSHSEAFQFVVKILKIIELY